MEQEKRLFSKISHNAVNVGRQMRLLDKLEKTNTGGPLPSHLTSPAHRHPSSHSQSFISSPV